MMDSMKRLYGPKDYKDMEVGAAYIDTYMGSTWIVKSVSEKGTLLKNAAGGDKGVEMNITPKSCRMYFFAAQTP